MFDSISLSQFKCFTKEQKVRLSRINVFYGKNGRGKSSVAQAFLLLAQTIQNSEVSYLQLNGKFVSLGLFSDVLSKNRENDIVTMKFHIEGSADEMIFAYKEDADKPSVGKLQQLQIDGKNLMEVKASDSDFGSQNTQETSLSAISGYTGYENFKNIFYVAANRKGQVNSEPRNDIDSNVMGVKGENLINLLLAKGIDFQNQVANALSEILDGATLAVKETTTREYVDLFLDSKDEGDSFRPVNVGFGYSYILPIIVDALLIPKGSMLIVENPEAHLFPAAQSRLIKFLIEVSKERDLQVIVESHSDHVVNGIRIAVKKNMLQTNEVVINYFDRAKDSDVEVRNLHIDRNGEMDDYPEDFMDEWTRQLLLLA